MGSSRGAALAALGAVAVAVAYVGAVDPSEPGHYPACPVLAYTGLHCPGCGGLRAVHALVHGEVAAALAANAVVVAGAVVALAGWLVWFLRPWPLSATPRVLPYAAGAVAVGFTVLRNLPFGGALTP